MAISKMFSVKDHKVGIYMRPFFELHMGSALRSWEDACASPESPFHKYPNDFSLFLLGEFDDLTGKARHLEEPELVASARDVIGSKQSQLL